MADARYGPNEIVVDALAEPIKKVFEEVTKEFMTGKCRSVDFDLAEFWKTVRESIELAFSEGFIFAGIRFVFSLILSRSEEPAYYPKVRVAKRVYAEYGDSRFKGVRYSRWRLSLLEGATFRLIEAQDEAEESGKHMDAARIQLLRGMLAQAALVWVDADRLFSDFVRTAKEIISREEENLRKNLEAQKPYAKTLTTEKGFIERLLRDPSLPGPSTQISLAVLFSIRWQNQTRNCAQILPSLFTSATGRVSTKRGFRIFIHSFPPAAIGRLFAMP